jgi:3-oxoadipate enol-lactonase
MINSAGLAEVNGTKLYYEAKGSGASVVLLHDGLLDSRVWDEQFESFARHHTVVRYDRRGYGRSNIAMEEFSDVEDLLHLLRVLGVSDAQLIGMSNGGRVALDFTLEHPDMVDSLVLVGSSLGGYLFSEETRTKVATTLSTVKAREMSKALRL